MIMSLKVTIGSFLMAAAFMVAGCDAIVYNTPSEISTRRVEVHRDSVDLELDTAALSPAFLQNLGQDYRKRGDSSMLVSVTYDPHSSVNTARRASDKAASLAAALNAQGVRNMTVDTLPVADSGEHSRTLISYNALRAAAAPDCDVLEMEMTTDLERMENYGLGCSIETYLARQVAKPADLLGNDVMDTSQGRYSANSLEPYMSGARNPALEGESASGE